MNLSYYSIESLNSQYVKYWSMIGNKYIEALLTLVLFFIGSYIVVWVSERIILQLTKKTKTDVDDLIVKGTNKHVSLILLIVGLRLALIQLEFSDNVEAVIAKVMYSIIIMIAASAIIKIFGILLDHWGKTIAARTKSTLDDNILSLIDKIDSILMYVIAVMMILSLWGVQIGPFLAGLGIGGIAVAFALQPTLANIFGGVSMVVDKTVNVGDSVVVDSYSGEVLDIGIRSTKIRTWDNELVIIPNSKLVDSYITNKTMPDRTIRIVLPFSVAYGSDPEKVKKIVMKIIQKVDGLKKDPEPFVRFSEMGASSLNFKAYFYVNDLVKKMAAVDFMNTNIYHEFKKAKIGIPYPQMDVHIKRK